MNSLSEYIQNQQFTNSPALLEYTNLTNRLILQPIPDTGDPVIEAEINGIFERLHMDMLTEPKLYPVGVETLITSWRAGLSSVVYDPLLKRIISHARLAPLSTPNSQSELGLPLETP